jgi:hypothetical protein
MAQTVPVFNGVAEVEEGELVSFAYDPGERWELVEEVKDVRDMWKTRRAMADGRDSDDDNEGGV